MEIGSCVKCAETFSACGCGSKAAERYEAYEDPITDRQEYKIDELGGKSDGDMTRSEASDYIKKLQGRESGTWRAESGPLPPDPRVSPLNKRLHTPSNSPNLSAEMEDETFVCARSGKTEYMDNGFLVPNLGMVSENHMTKEDWEAWDKQNALYNPDSYSREQLKKWGLHVAAESFGAEDIAPYAGVFDKMEVTFKIQDADDATFYYTTEIPSGLRRHSDEHIVSYIWGDEYKLQDDNWFYLPYDWNGVGEHYLAKVMNKTLKAESFGATSDELDCPSCKATPKERLGEPLCSTCNSCFECCECMDSFGAEDDIDFDKSKADRNKDGRISDWERAVGNKVAKGIRESKRAEVGPHVPTRIAATTTPRGVVKTYTSIPAGDGHVIGQFTPDMDYAPSGMYGAESLTSSIEKGFGAVLGIMSGLIVGGFAMGAVSSLSKDDENRE